MFSWPGSWFSIVAKNVRAWFIFWTITRNIMAADFTWTISIAPRAIYN